MTRPAAPGATGAPDLLASANERRRREMVRAALFGGEAEAIRIGRFRLEGRLGAGGMGVVYLARDDELGREVALKLVRSRAAEGSARLLREAQALARLSHPNVVTVFEVGLHDGQLFVAMERVQGITLAAWMKEKPRTAPEVIACFVQAGRALEAAHALGLVHRDFKPENAMIDEAGRVKVLDFGLVRRREDAPSPETSGAGARGAADPVRTEDGAILGTPAYMAPEQMDGRRVDGRADQFAFCVALFEALHGERPFPAATLRELREQIRSGPPAPPGRARVSARVTAAIARGLREDPAQRWPSMSELLGELSGSRRGRWAWLGGGVAAIGAAAAASLATWGLATPDVCTGAAAEAAQAWGDEQRAQIRRAFAEAEAGYAKATGERTIEALDRYAARWIEAHTEACRASQRGEQSAAMLDRRMACLRRRRSALGALAGSLASGGPKTVEGAAAAALSLPSIAACGDAAALAAEVDPPADAASARAVEIQRALAWASGAFLLEGDFPDALRAATTGVTEAERIGYEPFVAEARLRRGLIFESAGRFDEAAADLRVAYQRGLAAKHDAVAAEAARRLFTVLGYHQRRPEAAKPWEDTAAALVARVKDGGRLEADFLASRGMVHADAGRLEAAALDLEQALARYRAADGPDSLGAATALSHLARVASARSETDAAVRMLEEALALRTRLLGEDHPDLASLRAQLGAAHLARGDARAAVGMLESALSILAASGTPPERAEARYALARALIDSGGGPAATARAGREMRAALAEYRESGDAFAARRREAEAWALARGIAIAGDR